jgi:chromosome segregation ATPase
VRKIVVLEKEISSLDSTVKSQNHQIDRYKTDIQVNTDKISSLMNENNSMESELEKLKTKFADCKSNQELAHEKYQRMSEVENTALQIRVNELERTNDDLTHQIVELHDILGKQKHDHLLLVEQTARDNHNLLMKYRNDNTTLTVQLSNYMDKLTVQEKGMSSDILMLKRDRDKFCHDAIQLKNQLDLTSATVSNAIQSEERLKMSRTETESKLLLVEKEKRDLVIKSNENEHEVSMLIEKCRILEKNLDKVSCESLMLREQLQVVNDAYEQENSQTRANLENFRVQQEEQVLINLYDCFAGTILTLTHEFG